MASSDFIQRPVVGAGPAGTSSTSSTRSAPWAKPSGNIPGGSRTIRDRSSGSDYALLSRRVRSAGLMRHRPLRSVTALAVTLLLLTGGWAAFLLIGDSWWQLTVAVVLAFAFTQCGFRGHEAGHRQLFHGKRANDATGLVFGNLFIGLGFGWWVAKHNRHHAHPNQVGRDPDIETGALVVPPHATPDAARAAMARAVRVDNLAPAEQILIDTGTGTVRARPIGAEGPRVGQERRGTS